MRTYVVLLTALAGSCLCVPPAPAARPVDPAKGLVLSNDDVRLEFEPAGMGLSAMIDRRAEVNHIQPVSGLAAKKFVTYGQLLAQVEPVNLVPTFTEEQFGWQRKHRGTVPSAEARLWQSEDGHLGVLLANYLETPVSLTYRIDPAQYGLAGGRYRLSELTPEASVPLGTVSGPVLRTEELGPRKIKVIEIGR